MKFQICTANLTPATCPCWREAGKKARGGQSKRATRPPRSPSWESHRNVHKLKTSQGVQGEPGCELLHVLLNDLPGGDRLPRSYPQPAWRRHHCLGLPELSSSEYSRRWSPNPHSLCRNTALSMGFPGYPVGSACSSVQGAGGSGPRLWVTPSFFSASPCVSHGVPPLS